MITAKAEAIKVQPDIKLTLSWKAAVSLQLIVRNVAAVSFNFGSASGQLSWDDIDKAATQIDDALNRCAC